MGDRGPGFAANFGKYKQWEYNETVHHLFIDFKRAYDSVRREVLHNILMESP
jgi:hypothetical protein